MLLLVFTNIFIHIQQPNLHSRNTFIHIYRCISYSRLYLLIFSRCLDLHQRVLFILIIWPAPRVGKMNQIAHCDWLPEWARWSHLACLGLPAVSRKHNFPKSQVCSVKMAGYWPRSFFASLWTSTSSQSINTQKMNLVNIQPSWPRTSWSITHTHSRSK